MVHFSLRWEIQWRICAAVLEILGCIFRCSGKSSGACFASLGKYSCALCLRCCSYEVLAHLCYHHRWCHVFPQPVVTGWPHGIRAGSLPPPPRRMYTCVCPAVRGKLSVQETVSHTHACGCNTDHNKRLNCVTILHEVMSSGYLKSVHSWPFVPS